MDIREARLWRRKEAGDEQARHDLVALYDKYVVSTRLRMAPNPPPPLENEDLEQEARFALVKAVDNFNPSLGVAFSSYAIGRMRWAIAEALRKDAWAPRTFHRWKKALESADAAIYADGLIPSRETRCERLGMEMEEYDRMEKDWGSRYLLSLENPVTQDTDFGELENDVWGTLIDPCPTPEEAVVREDEYRQIWECVERLPPLHKKLMNSMYKEGKTIVEVASDWKKATSGTYVHHRNAVVKLREMLECD